jgi:hypothetical protein
LWIIDKIKNYRKLVNLAYFIVAQKQQKSINKFKKKLMKARNALDSKRPHYRMPIRPTRNQFESGFSFLSSYRPKSKTKSTRRKKKIEDEDLQANDEISMKVSEL